MRTAVAAFGILIFASLPAVAQNVEKAPPGGNYKRVSELVSCPISCRGSGPFTSIQAPYRRDLFLPMTTPASWSARYT